MTIWEVYVAFYPTLARRYGEDAAQDTGEALLAHPPYATDPAQIRQWLANVAYHAKLRTIKRGTHLVITSDGIVPEQRVDPRGQVDARLQLAKIPPDIVDIALRSRAMGGSGEAPTNTEKSRLHRWRKGK